jgi:hypothetical protein
MAGCGSLPRYQMVQSSPHKDMCSLQVFLPERAAPEVYQRIALDESARVQAGGAPGRLPLYEVKVEFLKSGIERVRLAQVVVILSGDPSPEVARADGPRLETTLY